MKSVEVVLSWIETDCKLPGKILPDKCGHRTARRDANPKGLHEGVC